METTKNVKAMWYTSHYFFFFPFSVCVCVCVCMIYWSIEGWSSARKSTGWRICLLLVLSPPEWRAFNLSEPLTKCVTHKMPVRVSHVSDGNWSFPEPNRPRPWLHSSRSARRAHRPVLPSRTALMKSNGTIRSESMETRTQQLDLMQWFVHSFGSRAAAALHSITPSVLTFENNVWMVVLCSRSDCCPQIRCQLVYNPGKYGRLDLLWVPIPTDAWQKSFAMMESSQGDHSSAGWRHRNKKTTRNVSKPYSNHLWGINNLAILLFLLLRCCLLNLPTRCCIFKQPFVRFTFNLDLLKGQQLQSLSWPSYSGRAVLIYAFPDF